VHQTLAAAFCYFVSKIRQSSVSAEPINQSRFPIWPALPHFSQARRTVGAGYSRSWSEPFAIDLLVLEFTI
jgi:hypothetical protein